MDRDNNRGHRATSQQGSSMGLRVLVAVLSVLLVCAIVTLVVLVVTSNGTKNKSAGSSAPSADTSVEENAVASMAVAQASKTNRIPWFAGGTRIVDDWARVGVGAPPQYRQQGELLYFHKVNGEWTFVAGGDTLQPSELAGCPKELLEQ